MNISGQKITILAFYQCPTYFQMIGCHPSQWFRLLRNYHANRILASQSLCASSQSMTVCHRSSSHRESNTRSLKQHSRSLHQDVPSQISLKVCHNVLMSPSFTIVSSIEGLMTPISSIECGNITNYPFVGDLNSYSSPSKLLLCVRPQSHSIEPYLNSPIQQRTNSSLKQPFLKTHPSDINRLGHPSLGTSQQLDNFSYTPLLPSKHLRQVVTSQPIKSSTIQSRHFSLANLNSPLLCPRHLHQSLTSYPSPQRIKSSLIHSRNFSLDGFYIALSQSPPVQTAQSLLLDLHQWLPWWLVIPVATLAVRTLVVLPLAVHQAQVVAKLAGVNAEMLRLAPELNKEVAVAKRMFGWDEAQAKKVFKIQLRQIYQRYVVRDNCHPFKMVLLVAFQIPLWICLSVSLRNLTTMANAGALSAFQMKSEGLLWFSDLTSSDPIFIPLMLLAVNLSLTEVHALRQVGKGSLLQKVMLNSSRVIIVFVAAAATFNPSSVTFYWLCSSTFGLCQNLLLMSPRIKRSLGIPKMASESATPYQDISKNLRKRLRR